MPRIRLLLLLLLAVLLAPPVALAHGVHASATQTFTQAVGPYELAVTLENTITATPAPLYLTVTPQSPLNDATITLRAAPRGQPLAAVPAVVLNGPPDALGRLLGEVRLHQGGAWELEVRAQGALGQGFARIPFTVTPPTLSPYTVPLLVAFATMLALMIIAVLLAALFHQLKRPAPAWTGWLIGQGLFACLLAAAIFGSQQFLNTLAEARQANSGQALGSLNTGYGRPHANLLLRTEPAQPQAGQPLTLTLELADGSTGAPIDDLTTHHESLLHLAVISNDGAFFNHLHPARVAPGRFAIAFTPTRVGRYSAYAEIARLNSGSQVLMGVFNVAGTAGEAVAAAPGLGTRNLEGDLQVTATTSGPLQAGRQTTFSFEFRRGDEPVRDIQLWLGMAGHLLGRHSDGQLFSHIHAAEITPSEEEDLATIRYGPTIRFAYTFPQPGSYQLWAQFRREGRIVTVPLNVRVEP